MEQPTTTTPSSSTAAATTLSPRALVNAAQKAGNLYALLNSSALALTTQAAFPTTSVKSLANINDHLTTAQGHANDWLNTYGQNVLNTLQGVITFGTLFNNSYTTMKTSVATMATEKSFDSNEISSLVSQLSYLAQQLDSQKAAATAAKGNLNTYRTGVSSDEAAFKTDYQDAVTAMTGDNGTIQGLLDRINSDNTAVQNAVLEIAGGAVSMVAGVLLIVAGALGEFETAGATTTLIVAGIAVLGTGGALAGVGGKGYDTAMNDLQQANTELANEQAELVMLTSLQTTFTNLTQALQTTVDAIEAVETSWGVLYSSINALIGDLDQPEKYLAGLNATTEKPLTPKDVANNVSASLATANTQWSTTVKDAQNILTMLQGAQTLTMTTLPTQQAILQAYNNN